MFRGILRSVTTKTVINHLIVVKNKFNKFSFVYKSNLQHALPFDVYDDGLKFDGHHFIKKGAVQYASESMTLELNKPIEEALVSIPVPSAPVPSAPVPSVPAPVPSVPAPVPSVPATRRERPKLYLWQTAPVFAPIFERQDKYQFLIDRLKSWEKLRPSPVVMRLIDKKCKKMILDMKISKIAYAYDMLYPIAFKIDLWRLSALYEFGGVYSDLHIMCTNSSKLSALLERYDYVFCMDKSTAIIRNSWIFVKHPRSLVVWDCMEKITENVYRKMWYTNPTAFTGDALISSVLRKRLKRDIGQCGSTFECDGEKYACLLYERESKTITFEGSTLMSFDYPNYKADLRSLQCDPHFSEMHSKGKIYR